MELGPHRWLLGAKPPKEQQTGSDPIDRVKLGSKRHLVVDARGIPLMIMVNGANRHDSMMFEKCMVEIPAIEGLPGRARKRPANRMRTKAKTTSAAGPASNDETSPAGLHEEVSRAAKSVMLLKAKGDHGQGGVGRKDYRCPKAQVTKCLLCCRALPLLGSAAGHAKQVMCIQQGPGNLGLALQPLAYRGGNALARFAA
ncbi:hypothetical protein Cthiooxydans_21640 [Comamonas thiooxydans]|nr:hypothetical protein Cthiooxydans_21640 [Comamonas thiooxydans]